MNQDRYNNRISQIDDAGLLYAYQMCILRIQKDVGYLQMQREYMMLLNIMDTLSTYNVSSSLFTKSTLRYLFELTTEILSSSIKEIISYNYTGTPDEWTYVESDLIIYRKGYRMGMYVIDKSTDGGISWDLDLIKLMPDEDLFIIKIDTGLPGFRQEVRSGSLHMDMELTQLGFNGIENIDWENIFIT